MDHYRYHSMIGTGGIGSGMFFALDGDHTLGREESRSGRFLDRRDYCKLHIVSHYVKVLLDPDFSVIPVGKVGADDAGDRLLTEMLEVGLDLRYVERAEDQQTLFAICLIYPDGSGGNLTVNDSACARVDAAFVARAEPEFARFAGRGIALALPEVPLEARWKLLELGTQYGFFRAASFTSAEIGELGITMPIHRLDLLALNLDEAAAVGGLATEAGGAVLFSADAIVETAVQALSRANPRLWVSITAGKRCSWSWDGTHLVHLPAYPAAVVSTAGAGDAHLAGILVGLTAGLPLAQAHQLGALVAALSITSPHTINKEINRPALRAFATTTAAPIAAEVWELLS